MDMKIAGSNSSLMTITNPSKQIVLNAFEEGAYHGFDQAMKQSLIGLDDYFWNYTIEIDDKIFFKNNSRNPNSCKEIDLENIWKAAVMFTERKYQALEPIGVNSRIEKLEVALRSLRTMVSGKDFNDNMSNFISEALKE
jgi:hypothetical protein